MPSPIHRRAALLALPFLLSACLPEPMDEGSEATSAATGEAQVEAFRVAFAAVDWRALWGGAFTFASASGERGPIGITPPGERFTCAMVTGTIDEAKLDELLRDVEARLDELIDSQGATVERRYAATEIPDRVADGVLLSSKRPLATCKGFGRALRFGETTANAEVLATPLGDEWRVDIYTRDRQQ